MAVVPFLKQSISTKLQCSECGASCDAACDCGAPYLSAPARVAKAIAEHPELSNRAIADAAGVSDMTVGRVRPATNVAPEKVLGRDGKIYPSKPRTAKSRRIVDEVDEEMDNPASATMRRRFFLRFGEDVLRKVEQGAGLKFAKAPEIDRAILSMVDDIVRAWSKLRDEINQRSQHG